MGRTIWHCHIAASLDGKIARPDGSVEDWLAAEYPAEDFGFTAFFGTVDAVAEMAGGVLHPDEGEAAE